MAEFCLNCNKPLPKGVQSSFCCKTCWVDYKERKGFAINPERQATIMLKDTSRSLISTLKEEIEKKDEIVLHQDKLIQDYRETLEARERDILKYQAKIKYYEGVVAELKQQVTSAAAKPASIPQIPQGNSKGKPESATSIKPSGRIPPTEQVESETGYQVLPIELISSTTAPVPIQTETSNGRFIVFWKKLCSWF